MTLGVSRVLSWFLALASPPPCLRYVVVFWRAPRLPLPCLCLVTLLCPSSPSLLALPGAAGPLLLRPLVSTGPGLLRCPRPKQALQLGGPMGRWPPGRSVRSGGSVPPHTYVVQPCSSCRASMASGTWSPIRVGISSWNLLWARKIACRCGFGRSGPLLWLVSVAGLLDCRYGLLCPCVGWL